MAYELSDEALDYTIDTLLKHCKNKNRFNKEANRIAVGGEDCRDYTNKSLRRTRASKKKYVQSIFINSAAAGSNFYHCTFDNCQIVNANFQECSFNKSWIINNMEENAIIHSNFNESLFSDEFVFRNTHFKHSVFYNSAFIKGKIENTTFTSCTLEATTFSDVEMENVQFTDLNIDYSVFENVKMKNVILPFSQICYAFGLLTYLKNTTDEVFITSVANRDGYISKSEFLELIPHFIKYYTDTKEFFPLANIYFYLEENEKAKQAILNGISEAVLEIDFKKIKYLCKLIFTYGVFNYHERQDIYNYIHSRITFYNMHSSLLYSYTVYKKEIEGYLLTNNKKHIVTVEINITTNVFPDEAEKLGLVFSTIEEVVDLYKSPLGEHKIECRHNSAETFLLILQDLAPVAVAIATSLYSVLMAYNALEDKRLERKIKKETLKTMTIRNELEVEKLEAELKSIKSQQAQYELDTELKKIELYNKRMELSEKENQIKKEILSKNISQNNIEITGISHIIYGNIPTQISNSLLQYNYQKSNC